MSVTALSPSNIMLSIIIPTIGRKEELVTLLESIVASKIRYQYEVIIVDQNEERIIDDICNKYSNKLNLTQYIVSFKGTSRAKNYGIKHAKGKIVCFPDDDAEFTHNAIAIAMEILDKHKYNCVFGKCIDKQTGKDSVIKFSKKAARLTLTHFENLCIEATTFGYKDVLIKYLFDENMGVGTIFGSQEGYDLVYRMLLNGTLLYYSPEIILYHPNKIIRKDSKQEVERAFFYSCGFGYLCYKHRFKWKYLFRMIKIKVGLIYAYMFKHRQLKYFDAQKLGIELGYKYLNYTKRAIKM